MARETDIITQKTKIEILKRSKRKCECCGEIADSPPHHIFFKSQYYGKDRSLPWNLADICRRCHDIIHHAGTDWQITKKFELDYKLKAQALLRYFGKARAELNLICHRAFLRL